MESCRVGAKDGVHIPVEVQLYLFVNGQMTAYYEYGAISATNAESEQ